MSNDLDNKSAAKALATVLLTLRGTPFIYEGQELGMTNVAWSSIDQYDDIQSHAQYEFALNEGFSPEQALEFIHKNSRDNARTPMQWDNTKNAGFTTGTPWLPVNENYPEVNAKVEDNDADSVLNWYRKLSKLRAENEVLLVGSYEELLPDSEEIFAFARTLGDKKFITAVNFSDKTVDLPKNFSRGTKILADTISNPNSSKLAPFEGRILANI